MQAHRSLMLLVECLAMAPVVPGESVPWGGDGHGFCVSNRPPTRPLPPTNSTARRSPKLLVNCELKLQLAFSSQISFCRYSRAEGGGSATVPFRLWMRGGTGLSRLARLLSLRPCPYIRWWHSRRRLSATASPRQHLPASSTSQPAFLLLRPVHRYHSRNAIPGHCSRRAEQRMRRALHPSALYPPHPSLCTCKLACQTPPMMM